MLTRPHSKLLDAIFPPRCIGCHHYMAKGDGVACRSCEATVFVVTSPKCLLCSLPRAHPIGDVVHGIDEYCHVCTSENRHFDGVFALWEYEGVVADVLRRSKRSRAPLADLLGLCQAARPWIDQQLSQIQESHGVHRILATPMHPWDRRRRGHNSAELIARWTGVVCAKPNPVRVIGRRQVRGEMSYQDRLDRARHRFEVPHSTFGTWVVIDDIMTTGSTMTALAAALKRKGAARVFGLVLARSTLI